MDFNFSKYTLICNVSLHLVVVSTINYLLLFFILCNLSFLSNFLFYFLFFYWYWGDCYSFDYLWEQQKHTLPLQIDLLPGLFKIHAPLVYLAIALYISVNISVFTISWCHSKLPRFDMLSFFLGSIWALKNEAWGELWSNDPIEWVLLCFIFFRVIKLHTLLIFSGYIFIFFYIFILFLFVYLIRSGLIYSKHFFFFKSVNVSLDNQLNLYVLFLILFNFFVDFRRFFFKNHLIIFLESCYNIFVIFIFLALRLYSNFDFFVNFVVNVVYIFFFFWLVYVLFIFALLLDSFFLKTLHACLLLCSIFWFFNCFLQERWVLYFTPPLIFNLDYQLTRYIAHSSYSLYLKGTVGNYICDILKFTTQNLCALEQSVYTFFNSFVFSNKTPITVNLQYLYSLNIHSLNLLHFFFITVFSWWFFMLFFLFFFIFF